VGLLVSRIGNEVLYVTQIIDDIHFAWQAQYLLRLAGDLRVTFRDRRSTS